MSAASHAAEGQMRVLIVDDHPIVASGCRALLAGEADIEILTAADADEAESAFLATRPDVCVLDVNLPGLSGFDLARRLLDETPETRVVMFSMNDSPAFAARAIEIGARGYVSKAGDPGDLLRAIRAVAGGGVFLPPQLAQDLAFAGPSLARNRLAGLTTRELEILRLIARGKSPAEIATIAGISAKTVANASSLIRQKLQARNAMDLMRIALDAFPA